MAVFRLTVRSCCEKSRFLVLVYLSMLLNVCSSLRGIRAAIKNVMENILFFSLLKMVTVGTKSQSL